jgi:hypothetical protein
VTIASGATTIFLIDERFGFGYSNKPEAKVYHGMSFSIPSYKSGSYSESEVAHFRIEGMESAFNGHIVVDFAAGRIDVALESARFADSGKAVSVAKYNGSYALKSKD